MKTTTLKISGMHCANCAANAQKALKALTGVVKADVSIETKKAVVEYDPVVMDEAKLKKAVEGAGYKVD